MSTSRSTPTTSATPSSTSRARSGKIRAAGGGFVGLVGVQSNQYPRALDLAREFRAAGVPVVIGGFHVSGCISMLPKLPADLQEALDLGVTLFAGEGEGRLADAGARHRQPEPRSRSTITSPTCPRWRPRPCRSCRAAIVTRVSGNYTSFDAGRGCPFQCSFCTIINVQGRKSRYRTPDDVEEIVRANAKQGVTKFFVTDDNFARNRTGSRSSTG